MKQQNLLKANQQSLQQQQHQLPPHPHQLQQQQQQPQQYPLTKIQTHDPSSNKLPPPEATIPNSNAINSEMYERDKQIYKCSTMRQGGKYDAKGQPIYSAKPSILNCPLPEIPKEASESGATPTTQSKVDYCHTLR
jgi:protein tweety